MSAKSTPVTNNTGRWLVVLLLLLSVATSTGLALVDAATDTRQLYKRLSLVQREHDKLLEEQSRLNLERSAISNLQAVEEVAMTELDMHFPDQVRSTEDD